MPLTEEERRANGAKGGYARNDPDYLIGKITAQLPALTTAQRRRLIALLRVVEAVEAAEAAS